MKNGGSGWYEAVVCNVLALHSFVFVLFVELLAVLGRAHIGLRARPLVGLFRGFVFGDAVAFLDAADQLVFLSGYLLPVAIGEFAPFFAGLTRHLLPVSFYSVPVHMGLILLRLLKSTP